MTAHAGKYRDTLPFRTKSIDVPVSKMSKMCHALTFHVEARTSWWLKSENRTTVAFWTSPVTCVFVPTTTTARWWNIDHKLGTKRRINLEKEEEDAHRRRALLGRNFRLRNGLTTFNYAAPSRPELHCFHTRYHILSNRVYFFDFSLPQ